MANVFNFPDIKQCWFPVRFQPKNRQYSVLSEPILFDNDLKFNISSCLKNYKSFSSNKKTGLFLTELSRPSNLLKINQPEDITPISKFKTLLSTQEGAYDKILVTVNNNLFVSDKAANSIPGTFISPQYSQSDVFTFNFFTDPTVKLEDAEREFVSLENSSGLLLTWGLDPVDPSLYFLTFRSAIRGGSLSQRFSYLLAPDGICLFLPNSNFHLVVRRNFSTDNATLDNLNTENNVVHYYENSNYKITTDSPQEESSIQNTVFLKFVSCEVLLPEPEKKLGVLDSFLTKYSTGILDREVNLQPDSTKSIELGQNYLGIFPIENYSMSHRDVVYNLELCGLKNYQTPEYNYSFSPSVSGSLREYNKIFTGTNQTGGYENIYLGYTSNTTEKVFVNDKESFFSYPPTALRKSVHDSGLIEDGATAGHHPLISDRIYLRQIDYTSRIPDYIQPESITKYSNTWLCAWLSGSNSGSKVWVDRYYNASYYTLDQALSAQAVVYNDRTEPTKEYIFDVPSSLYLEPGAFYRYHRSGLNDSKKYLSLIDEYSTDERGSKVLEISSWNSSPLIDHSGYNNNGQVYAENNSLLYQDHLNLDGSTHVVFPAKTSLLDTDNFAVSLWVKVDDWSNIIGRQIFGNFYNSGYGLINESAIPAALMTLFNPANGEVFNLNYNLKQVSFNQLKNYPLSLKDKYLINRLPDFSFWVFDTANGTGYKFDAESRLIAKIEGYYGVSQIEIDHLNNLYLLMLDDFRVIKLNSDGKQIDLIKINNFNTKRIELILVKNTIKVIEIFGHTSVIDNDGNIWEVLGNNLYKTPYNKETLKHGSSGLFATIGYVQQITCDSSNNLWLLHGEDYVSKMSQNGIFSTVRIGKRSSLLNEQCFNYKDRYRYINFLRVPQESVIQCDKSTYIDYIIIVDKRDNEIYVLESNGDLVSKMSLLNLEKLVSSSNLNFFAEGDFTGYQNLRKFYIGTKKISWKFKIGEVDGSNTEILSLTYDATLLKPGWHQFGLSFSSSEKRVNYFIDSELVDYKILSTNKSLIFDYRSSLLLGTDAVRNSSINDIIGVQNTYKFKGQVAELKVYNKFLSKGDMHQVYYSSPRAAKRKNLIWNMSTGNRDYIEEIKHWFKMQLPGSKSKYYNINIHNFPVNEELRNRVEEAVRSSVEKLAPAQSTLYKINWY
jgi:hypothetical protein